MAATQQGAIDVSWVMLKAAKTVPVTAERAEINGSSLSFRAVSEKDTSWYRCNYKKEQARRCYDINLQVQGQAQGQGLSHCKVQVLFQVPRNNKSYYYHDCAWDLPPGTENNLREENEEKEEQYSSRPVAAAVTVVLLAIAMAVALAGFFLHRRRNSQTAAPQAQRQLAGLKP